MIPRLFVSFPSSLSINGQMLQWCFYFWLTIIKLHGIEKLGPFLRSALLCSDAVSGAVMQRCHRPSHRHIQSGGAQRGAVFALPILTFPPEQSRSTLEFSFSIVFLHTYSTF